jgi:hypothetical protein
MGAAGDRYGGASEFAGWGFYRGRHGVGEDEVLVKSGGGQHPVGDGRVAHQSQGATLLGSELVGLE